MINFISLNPITVSYVWLIVAILFLVAEMSSPGLFFFISFSVGAVFASAASYWGYFLVVQCLVFLAVTLVAFFVLRHYFSVKSGKRVQTNVDALVGQEGVVLISIEPNKLGRVKVKREEWPAEGVCDSVLHKDTLVVVVAVSGNRVIVKKK